ncbi:MAG: DUF58 domain-containing protein [Planctomycetes bacterium]|nr:DUF58 domain-containing protein [Planctomycetota bacterium]
MSDSRKYLRPEILSRISRLELRARTVVEGFVSGMHRSPYHGFSVEFAEHREYVPGDDIRHIDWRVFAKTDRYYIKQYEEETNLRSHILLDCSGSMAYPESRRAGSTGRMTKWDYASTVAASLAFLQSKQQDAIGLTLFDHEIRRQIPSAANPRQLSNMIRIIEEHTPHDKTDVKILFRYLADRIKRRSMVVVISDFLTDLDDVIAGLQRLRHTRHEVMVMHVLDQDELEFPFVDQTLFEGIEFDQELLTDPQALRKSYLDQLERFIHRLRSFCMDTRIDYVLLSTADRLDVALATFLARRSHAMRTRAR